MGCVFCNLVSLTEKEEPFPSESAKQDFMNELAKDIAQQHPDLASRIIDHCKKTGSLQSDKLGPNIAKARRTPFHAYGEG